MRWRVGRADSDAARNKGTTIDDAVTAVPAEGDEAGPRRSSSAITKGQIRGSSLLLAGRFIALGVNFAVQVLIARYLSRTEYGAFAYALSYVTLGETIVTAGLDRGLTRFLAMYDERGDYPRLFGALVLVAGTILSLGLCLILLVIGLQGWIGANLIDDQQAVTLLLILVALAPIQAADNLLSGVLAVFSSARAIFFRKYLLGPGLRLLVVGLLILGSFQVDFLAAGYVLAGLAGIAVYLAMLWRIIGERGLRERFRVRAVSIPFREIFAFTLPLLTTDLVYLAMNTSDAIVLGHFHGTDEVAALRVVGPLAGLNQVVFSSFTLLYMPAASRLLVRGERGAIGDLYWRTAVWMAVFSFPVFAVTTSLAQPVTVALYGARYEPSAVFLALLSFGSYFNAALGFNGLTIRVFGMVRYTVVINVVAAVVNLVLNLVLIPPLGALGAALSTTIALLLHNVLKQAGLLRVGIDIFDPRYLRVYLVVALAAAGLGAIQLSVHPHVVVGVGLAAIASAIVLLTNRSLLRVGETFPELLRLPFLARLLGETP